MIDLSKVKELRQRQDSVEADGKEYPVKTEFCFWINFDNIIKEWQRTGKAPRLDSFDCLYAAAVPENRQAGFEGLQKFWQNRQPLPHDAGRERNYTSMDWAVDSERIRALFLKEYGIDLVTEDLHWHDFLGLFYSALADMKYVLSARAYSKYESKRKPEDIQEEDRRRWDIDELDGFKPEIIELV